MLCVLDVYSPFFKIVQSLIIINIGADWLIRFCFVFPHMAITHNGVDVSGMELVRVLCGHSVHGELGAVCMKLFPSQYNPFLETYGVQDDITHSFWINVIVWCQHLLTQQLGKHVLNLEW